MKRIALVMLLIFTLVQVLPAVNVMASDAEVVSVFNPDEEKGAESSFYSAEDLKEKKNNSVFFDCNIQLARTSQKYTSAGTEGNLPMPVFDLQTPPPNLN